jgi:hypothetical protein
VTLSVLTSRGPRESGRPPDPVVQTVATGAAFWYPWVFIAPLIDRNGSAIFFCFRQVPPPVNFPPARRRVTRPSPPLRTERLRSNPAAFCRF